MTNKKKKNGDNEKVDFPRLYIGEAVKLTEKVVNNYGGIISYTELSKIAGAGGKTQGGTFGNLTKSLKLYKLMERFGLKEMKVTDEGNRMVGLEEDRKKTFLFELYKRIPIIFELYDRYKDNVPKNIKSITDFLTRQKGLEKRDAGRLANLYRKNQEFFGELSGEQPSSEGNSFESKVEPVSNLNKGNTQTLCKISYLLGKLSPKEEGKSKESLFDSLIKLASENNFKSLEAFSEATKFVPEDKKSEMFKKLRKSFEEDSQINLEKENN